MRIKPFRTLAMLGATLTLIACAAVGPAAADSPYGSLNGVLAAGAPILFVPVGVDARGCTLYTKKPLRDGIFVDTGIWYRTTDDQFVLDATRCVPDDLVPEEKPQ